MSQRQRRPTPMQKRADRGVRDLVALLDTELSAPVLPPGTALQIRLGLAALLRSRTLLKAIRGETKSGELDAVPILLRSLCETFLAGAYCLVGGKASARKLVRSSWVHQEKTTKDMALDPTGWEPTVWGLPRGEPEPTAKTKDRLQISEMHDQLLE